MIPFFYLNDRATMRDVFRVRIPILALIVSSRSS
jgi:hypothetical protein